MFSKVVDLLSETRDENVRELFSHSAVTQAHRRQSALSATHTCLDKLTIACRKGRVSGEEGKSPA